MSEVEGGTALAWRLLATLEGGSLLLATSALLAYSIRKRLGRIRRPRRPPVDTVMLTNTTNALGKVLKTRLESLGCVVRQTPNESDDSDATSGADSVRVDALIVVGAHATSKPTSLEAIANLVNDDVYHNLKVLESLSPLVKRGGYIAWACAGAPDGSFRSAGDAFDAMLEASLRRVARLQGCEAVWVGRGRSVEAAAERVLRALPHARAGSRNPSSIRDAVNKVGEYIGGWLKNVT
ncbi:unnamed protein product [Chilo suppressalis]|uniref:Flavodoxin-like domain-containing protein n=1 Tax=Chilo suppressalis TaxID=168631 RepID=A0ABN8EBL9_CHISP|nr:unnamed protein product [Chilo suppressalis]